MTSPEARSAPGPASRPARAEPGSARRHGPARDRPACANSAQVRRQRADGTWTGPFRVPRSYLADNAELGYGGNVHVAQGRTVDTAHLLLTDSLSRQPCMSA